MHKTKAQKAKAATRLIPEEDPEFQIAPMIDILLVLLVFFMSIATDQVLQVNKEVVLPVAKVDAPDTKGNPSEVIINVLWNLDGTGKVDVDGKGPMEFQPMTDFIAARREQAEATGKDFQVKIRADKRALYQYVRQVMASIGQAKVPTVIFSAVDKEIDQPKP
jgi:biopolymer transport protein ExbD